MTNLNNERNIQEARDYIDNEGKREHGILSKNIESAEVSEKAFNDTFPKDWDEGGFQMTGTFVNDIMDEHLFRNEDPYKEVREILPNYIKERAEEDQNDFLVQEGNVTSHIENNILNNKLVINSEDESVEGYFQEDNINGVYKAGYKEVVNAFEINSPEEINSDGTLKTGKTKEKLIEFIKEKIAEESVLKINGVNIYLEKRDELDNASWGKKFFEI